MKYSDPILDGAISFHGHLGPYLVLGLKAGIYANEILGKNPMKMHAIVSTNPAPPHSCSADGVQYSTGCTLGKNNIALINGPGLTITFTSDQRTFTLNLKKEIIDEIQQLPNIEIKWEELAFDFYQRPIDSLFFIS